MMSRLLNFATISLTAAAIIALQSQANAQVAPDYNYIGIGGGDDGFVVNSKLTVNRNLSVRPSVATDFDFDDGEDVSYLVPLTYDFNALDADSRLYPFVGAGIGGEIGDDSTVDFALTAGADYRLSDRWVANGAVNYLPWAETDEVGFALGMGYTFGR